MKKVWIIALLVAMMLLGNIAAPVANAAPDWGREYNFACELTYARMHNWGRTSYFTGQIKNLTTGEILVNDARSVNAYEWYEVEWKANPGFQGTLEVTIAVYDVEGGRKLDQLRETGNLNCPAPKEPTCNSWTVEPKEGEAPLTVSGVADFSDPDGQVESSYVDWGDGDTTSTALVHTYADSGVYNSTYVLVTQNGEIRNASCTAEITVSRPEPKYYYVYLPGLFYQVPEEPCSTGSATAAINGQSATIGFEPFAGKVYDFGLWGLGEPLSISANREVAWSVSSEWYHYLPSKNAYTFVGLWPLSQDNWSTDPIQLRAGRQHLIRLWYFDRGVKCQISGWAQWDPPENNVAGIRQADLTTTSVMTDEGEVKFDPDKAIKVFNK